MVQGLLARKTATPADLSCMSGPDSTAADLAARTGIIKAKSANELIAGADAVVLAFKPQTLADIDPRLAELTAGMLVFSILAGKRLIRLQRSFPRARNIVRCMPNTPAQIGAGVTAWCSVSPLTSKDRETATTLLSAMGSSVELPEGQMDAATGLSGSGPAYVFEFVAALRDAGMAAGLPVDTAGFLAFETLLGSARLLAQRNVAPEKLRDEVASPNGTTSAGLQSLSEGEFRAIIRQTVLAATARSRELSGD